MCKPTKPTCFKRMTLQASSGCSTMKQQHVHTETTKAHPLAVNDAEQLHGLTFDARFFKDFFHCNFTCRISNIGPTGWIQPDTRIGSLHEKYFAIVVTDNCADRYFRRDVTRNSFADRLHPFLDKVILFAANF